MVLEISHFAAHAAVMFLYVNAFPIAALDGGVKWSLLTVFAPPRNSHSAWSR